MLSFAVNHIQQPQKKITSPLKWWKILTKWSYQVWQMDEKSSNSLRISVLRVVLAWPPVVLMVAPVPRRNWGFARPGIESFQNE